MNNIEIVNAILAARKVSTAAYVDVLLEAQALPPAAVRVLNADVTTLVARVQGAVPNLLAMREEIARQAPQVQFFKIQKIETYAHALREAHVHCLTAGKSPDELRALAEEGNALRDTLRADAFALAKRGLIDGSRLESCLGQPGYKVIALDLDILVEVMQSSWPKIKGKCAMTEAELQRATAISQALTAYVGARELSPEAKAAAMDIRDRMFTLLVDNYDEGRRVATFVRWHQGDVDELVPSLFAGKNRRRNAEEDEDDQNKTSPTDPRKENATPANANPPAITTPAPGNSSGNATPVNSMFSKPTNDPFMH